jgi:hypothetical protein
LEKPFSFNPFGKAVPIQLIWKSRSHSTHMRKPSPFNPYEKAVPIQPVWKSRPHSTRMKSRSHSTQPKLRWPPSCVDHPAALTKAYWNLHSTSFRPIRLDSRGELPGGVFCRIYIGWNFKLKLTCNSDSLLLKLRFATL